MREGPDFVLWFMEIGIVVVLAGLGISAMLFLVFRRWSQKQARLEDEKAGATRRP
jgi:hypothetical protein